MAKLDMNHLRTLVYIRPGRLTCSTPLWLRADPQAVDDSDNGVARS